MSHAHIVVRCCHGKTGLATCIKFLETLESASRQRGNGVAPRLKAIHDRWVKLMKKLCNNLCSEAELKALVCVEHDDDIKENVSELDPSLKQDLPCS